MTKKKILFITPSLARTGSEMVLWYLLKNIDPDKFTPYVFCLREGELYNQLPPTIKKTIAYKGTKSWYKKAFRGFLKLFGIEPIGYQLKQIQSKFKADLWYVNTILIPQAHPIAKELNVNIATHIHELLFAYTFIKAQEFKQIIDYSTVTIGCSTLVCEKLSDIGHSNIKLQNSFIDEKAISPDQNKINEIKKELGISGSDFVWVISGTVAYMKGLDYVLQLIEHFKNEPVKIVWIGAVQNNGLSYYVQNIVEKEYPGKLIFTGAVNDFYYEYLSLANGLLLLSKEESFSLVMLEAAYLGIPIVAFNTGMAKNFIKEGMGKLVDSWNVADMITAMTAMHLNLDHDDRQLKDAVLEYTVANQLPKFENLLLEL
jgi:glycosyltransferase involved in cell wall biosynthesis